MKAWVASDHDDSERVSIEREPIRGSQLEEQDTLQAGWHRRWCLHLARGARARTIGDCVNGCRHRVSSTADRKRLLFHRRCYQMVQTAPDSAAEEAILVDLAVGEQRRGCRRCL